MLSQLDHIIFPDRCEVYETQPSQRYVYAIYKNGSSSLMMCATDNKWKVLINEQIRKISSIDVILRDPAQRVLSGINIFLQQILKQHPDLDQTTAIWFIKNYLFLNRHYCPQFFWLVNLAKYCHPDAQLNFYAMSELWNIVDRDFKPTGYEPMPENFSDLIGDIPSIEMYHRIDRALIDTCMGKSIRMREMIQYIKGADPMAYEYVLGREIRILESLGVLS